MEEDRVIVKGVTDLALCLQCLFGVKDIGLELQDVSGSPGPLCFMQSRVREKEQRVDIIVISRELGIAVASREEVIAVIYGHLLFEHCLELHDDPLDIFREIVAADDEHEFVTRQARHEDADAVLH